MTAIQNLHHASRRAAAYVTRARHRAGGHAVPRLLAILVAGLLGAGLFTATLAAGAQVGAARNGELVADGAWCWFQDPRAVHYVGAHDRTYVGYVDSHGDIDIVSQDAGTSRLVHTTLHAGLQVDDHAAPGLVVVPDGRIIAFYSTHGGLQMFYRISVHPEDISSFGPEKALPANVGMPGYTYANPIYLSAEHRLYLFLRGGDNHPVMTWTADYLHWTTAVDVVMPRTAGRTPFTRPYAKYATNGKDTVAITFTDDHPDVNPPVSVYALIYKAGVLRTPNGTRLTVLDPTAEGDEHELDNGLPIGPAHIDSLRDDPSYGAVVYQDPGTVPAWPESMALDSTGAPIVVYASYRDRANAQYRYAHWNGTAWADIAITGAGGPIEPNDPAYSGGADLDQNSPGTVYLSRETQPGSRRWEIEKWTTTAPATLAHITQNSTVKNVRPVVPWGRSGEIRVLWMSGTYTAFFYGYHTQLRELTAGSAPTTARISASSTAIRAGSTVSLGARVVQGYRGAGAPGATVDLLGHAAGHPDYVVRTARADTFGLATFTVRPTETMRFTVRAPASSAWGYSTSASIVVAVARRSAVRISTSAVSIKRGTSVVVGMRAIDSATSAYLPAATIELWQSVAGGSWQRIARFTADAVGLVRVTRTPSTSVSYQARLVGNAAHQAAVSLKIAVHVS